MDRRRFLKNGGLIAASWAAEHGIESWRLSGRLLAAENGQEEENIKLGRSGIGRHSESFLLH